MSLTNTGSSVDPTNNNDCPTATNRLGNCALAALDWHQFGLQVIPIQPMGKIPAVTWDDWLAHLSSESIAAYWKNHSDHEVGFIVGPDLIVLDADSPESQANLVRIESVCGVSPRMIVKTRKGEHHYYRLAPGTFARSAAFSTDRFPAGIDVKTGRAMVVLPPSTGKEILSREVDHASQLSEVNQDFVDAIAHHNGRPQPPRPVPSMPTPSSPEFTLVDDAFPLASHNLEVLTSQLDPDAGYDSWVEVGMILFHETGGSEEGLRIFDAWSAGGAKYPGFPEIRSKWRSFGGYAGQPKTIGTLIRMLKEQGLDWRALLAAGEPDFTAMGPTEVVSGITSVSLEPAEIKVALEPASEVAPTPAPINKPNPLLAYSLTGMREELQREAREQIPILGQMAVWGQYTLFFAAPNTGKTLLTYWMLIEAFKTGRINPNHIFYLNADDHQAGLIQKLELAEKWRFHLIVPEYKGFSVKKLLSIIRELQENDLAAESVIILDTVKKFTTPMDKIQVSAFNDIIRPFIAKGGTVIGLAHTNKNRNQDGKPIYGGTSDLVDDADCAYTIDVVATDDQTKICTVEFERIKGRGGVVNKAAYRYSFADRLSYHERLATVEEMDAENLQAVKHSDQVKSDQPIIDAIKNSILGGITLKMDIIRVVAASTKVSQGQVRKVLELYTGDFVGLSCWNFTKGARGAMNYHLLDQPVPAAE